MAEAIHEVCGAVVEKKQNSQFLGSRESCWAYRVPREPKPAEAAGFALTGIKSARPFIRQRRGDVESPNELWARCLQAKCRSASAIVLSMV
jgi:hypothetical protein